MDVVKTLRVFLLLFFVVACDNRDNNPSTDESTFIKAEREECDGASLNGEYLVHWKNGDVTIERAENDEAFINNFIASHRDEILTSEPHYTIRVEQSVVTESSGWSGYPNWGVDLIGAAQVWGEVDKNTKIKVAVIDSGVDIAHPQLINAIAVNEAETLNGLDDDGNGLIDDIKGYDFVNDSGEVVDYTGHGTHVSGVIAAQHGAGDVLGVAPNVKILPIAFLSNGGGGTVDAAIRSIRYAASQKVSVINASWGGSTCSILLKGEIEALADKNILFVTAAGNSGNNLFEIPEYPAAFRIDNMITVGATSYSEKFNTVTKKLEPYELMAGFSNFGDLVDFMAPGAAITSTYPPEFDKDGKLDGMATINGTSMATPHVAAAAALLWSIKPAASYAEIKAALVGGVRPGPFRVKARGSLYLPTALEILTSDGRP